MTELKNMTLIKNEELNEVTGGFSGHVSMYDGVIGETYYFVNDHYNNKYIKGVLLRSYEESVLFWTRRMHEVLVIESNYSDNRRGDKIRLEGDSFTMYLFK